MTVYVVETAFQLSQAFRAASGGDRIELAPGEYGWTALKNRDFTKEITITSQNPDDRAVFTDTLNLDEVSGIRIEGIDVVADSLARQSKEARVSVTSSSDITFTDVLIDGHVPTAAEGVDPTASGTRREDIITGYGYETGMRIRWSDNVTVADVEIRDVRGSLALSGVKNSTFSGLDIHDVREGMNVSELRNVTIENSHVHDLKPWQESIYGDHPDMIQFWASRGATHASSGVTIRNNLFEQEEGSQSQTIFGSMQNHRTGLIATDFVIADNIIVNAQTNAIRVQDIDGLVVSGNILLPNADGLPHHKYPSIYFANVSNAVVSDNTVMKRWQSGDVVPMTDEELTEANIEVFGNTLMSSNPDSPNYWKIVAEAVAAGEYDAGPGVPTSPEVPVEPSNPEGPVAPLEPEKPVEPSDPPNAVVLAPEDIPDGDTRAVTQGNGGHNVFNMSGDGGYAFGKGGRDRFFSGNGDDYMVGGAGSDYFEFNYKAFDEPQQDTISDLDFTEGDVVKLIGDMVPGIDDSIDPDNNIAIYNKWDIAILDSMADLREAVKSEAFTATEIEHGIRIGFTEAPDYSIDLLNYTMDELIL